MGRRYAMLDGLKANIAEARVERAAVVSDILRPILLDDEGSRTGIEQAA